MARSTRIALVAAEVFRICAFQSFSFPRFCRTRGLDGCKFARASLYLMKSQLLAFMKRVDGGTYNVAAICMRVDHAGAVDC